jgi:hypothetical protein
LGLLVLEQVGVMEGFKRVSDVAWMAVPGDGIEIGLGVLALEQAGSMER